MCYFRVLRETCGEIAVPCQDGDHIGCTAWTSPTGTGSVLQNTRLLFQACYEATQLAVGAVRGTVLLGKELSWGPCRFLGSSRNLGGVGTMLMGIF